MDRICTGCCKAKAADEFVRDASKRTGFGPRCKACHRDHERAVKEGTALRKQPRTTTDRFWSQVEKGDGCWLWRGYGREYGRMRVGNRFLFVHRLSWEWAHGPIPGDLRVLHRCDTPRCVRPDHLFLGTIADNNRDRHLKGRDATGDANGARLCRGQHKGARNPSAKLSDADVASARAKRTAGARIVDLAREYGVSTRHMGEVVRGRIR